MNSTATTDATAHSLDGIYKALSDGTRRAIIARLASGPASIGAVAEPFDMSLAAIGKHVKVLESVGLVRRTIEWRTHILTLDPAALQHAEQWLSNYRHFWSGSLDALAKYVETDDDDV